ncbi:tRNA pseudouridine(55) synthase TruB [Candidatus Uabimicrobium sp. HlEnr_7]|uniref:tRNA pseudouridine(55) synthase TruB n=1 Tax=Candidatus Uabimicrobium helgolandensis TaxID=3095367 RepID=UPI00355768E4
MNIVTSGLLLIDKPLGDTSRQALFSVQKIINSGRLGHTGTLDPLATGLLVLLCGQARKLQNILTLDNKEYDVTVSLGAVSETDDSEGPIHTNDDAVAPGLEEVKEMIGKFTGEIDQVPPRYSAIKIKGKRAYKSAREGEIIAIPSRKVRIDKIDLIDYNYPSLTLKVKCGSGTYIRSLARDIGEGLGVGGYVRKLRRTQVGDFRIEDSSTINEISIQSMLRLEDVAVRYQRIDLNNEYLIRICNGQKIAQPQILEKDFRFPTFLWIDNRVIAIAKISDGVVSSRKLLIDNTF